MNIPEKAYMAIMTNTAGSGIGFDLEWIEVVLLLAVGLIAGVIIAWLLITSTVIHRYREEIKQAKDEAERANTAKSRFLANISQEIRTPINTIMGMNEMAMREDATGVPKTYFMSMMNYAFDIRNASETLLSLINGLLDISRIESDQMHLSEREYDIREMLRAMVSVARARATEKKLTFEVIIDEILPIRMYGDEGKIKQIVLNLLTNAVKYTDNGKVTFYVSMDGRVDDECRIRFSVKDTGIGIKKDKMKDLFRTDGLLEEQKKENVLETELGLGISHQFAGLLGGTLTCESEYGEGSEFVFFVNQKIVDKTPVGIFSERDESILSGPYVPQFVAPDADILVVDDNPMNLNVIKNLLKSTKVFVSTAANGEECLEKLKDTRFNVVFLDQMMPGMDGIETVARIRERYPDLPVYALTANLSAEEEFYRANGFNGFLSKPINSLALEKTIMKHLPEEMMEKPAANEPADGPGELPEELGWLYDVEGLSVEDGLRNAGNVPNYLFSINLFLDTIDANAQALRNAFESGDKLLYVAKLHVLKSSAGIIGAMELFELASAIDEAGSRDDAEFIDENTFRLLTEYEAFKEKLAGLKKDDTKE